MKKGPMPQGRGCPSTNTAWLLLRTIQPSQDGDEDESEGTPLNNFTRQKRKNHRVSYLILDGYYQFRTTPPFPATEVNWQNWGINGVISLSDIHDEGATWNHMACLQCLSRRHMFDRPFICWRCSTWLERFLILCSAIDLREVSWFV